MKKAEHGTFIFLGTGAANGAPVIGCSCEVCRSLNPKNRRQRASGYIQIGEKGILIDTGPDIRQQALTYNIKRVDALLLTHTHYDHVGGLEEMRAFNFFQQGAIPCFLSEKSFQEVQQLFYYLFQNGAREANRKFTATFDFIQLVGASGTINCAGIPASYFRYYQGDMCVLGYRFGDLAYVTDIKHYDESIFAQLQNLSVLIVSAQRFTPSSLQFTVDEAVDFALKVKAKTTYLMHLSHEVEYDHLQNLLPDSFMLAYDGLQIPFYIV